MIAVGDAHRKTKGSVKLAINEESRDTGVYFVPDGDYPLQRPSGSPLSLIDPDWLLKNVFRKYALSKREIKALIQFYSDFEQDEMVFESWKLRQAYQVTEQRMLTLMKTTHLDPTARFMPYFDPMNLRSCAFVAPSGSGKTYLATDILLKPELRNVKCYVFSLNIGDPSLMRLKERGRSTVFVDLDKIDRPLILERDFPPGCVLYFDDVFDGLPKTKDERGFSLRQSLLDLMNKCLVKGRHHRKSKTSPGCTVFLCSHVFKSGRDSSTLWTEVKNLFVFPSASSHSLRDFMRTKLLMHPADIKRILKLSGGTRWLALRLVERPMAAIWEKGVLLL